MPFVYVRKEAKGYGSGGAVFGRYRAGQKVALIDDLIAFGKQKLRFVEHLREANLVPIVVAVILDVPRPGNERKVLFEEKGLKLISLVRQQEVIDGYEQADVWPKPLVTLIRDFESNFIAWQGNKAKWQQFEKVKQRFGLAKSERLQ